MSRRRVGPVSDQAIVDQELAQQLVDRAKAEGVKLTGPGGLLGDLTKRVLEAGLEGETDGHLGYVKHTVEGRDGGNSRNGIRTKTVITESARSTSTCHAIVTAHSTRRLCASTNVASVASMRWCCRCQRKG